MQPQQQHTKSQGQRRAPAALCGIVRATAFWQVITRALTRALARTFGCIIVCSTLGLWVAGDPTLELWAMDNRTLELGGARAAARAASSQPAS